MKIPLSSPDITDMEKNAVLEVLNTPNLSLGPRLGEFEEKFAREVGSSYGIAVNSGTSGLHLCIRSLNITENDEVLTSPFSFISSANCILFERGKPVFVDIEKDTYNIDLNKLEDTIKTRRKESNKLKAILPVHIFGLPCEMDEIVKLANTYELSIIEDACEAIGAKYKNSDTKPASWRKVGSFGDCAVFAFYPNKQMTTGEGGMIVTDRKDIYDLCISMRNQGRSEENIWLQHQRLGYNYRLSDINCALGIVQLTRLDEILTKRAEVAEAYNLRLRNMDDLILPIEQENKIRSWFVYVVRLADKYSQKDRDELLDRLRQKGIGCSNYFAPIHLQKFYRDSFGYKRGDFPMTEKLSDRTVALPFHNNLKPEHMDYVCENLTQIIKSL